MPELWKFLVYTTSNFTPFSIHISIHWKWCLNNCACTYLICRQDRIFIINEGTLFSLHTLHFIWSLSPSNWIFCSEADCMTKTSNSHPLQLGDSSLTSHIHADPLSQLESACGSACETRETCLGLYTVVGISFCCRIRECLHSCMHVGYVPCGCNLCKVCGTGIKDYSAVIATVICHSNHAWLTAATPMMTGPCTLASYPSHIQGLGMRLGHTMHGQHPQWSHQTWSWCKMNFHEGNWGCTMVWQYWGGYNIYWNWHYCVCNSLPTTYIDIASLGIVVQTSAGQLPGHEPLETQICPPVTSMSGSRQTVGGSRWCNWMIFSPGGWGSWGGGGGGGGEGGRKVE